MCWHGAAREERILLTFDKDFGELARGKQLPRTCGVVLLRMPMPGPGDVGIWLSGRGEGALDSLGIVFDHFQQDAGRPFRHAAALLPITQRPGRNTETSRKLGLR